jgi:hypothetical protein
MRPLRSFLKVVLATLREIFDENAYQRFLLRTGRVASRSSYHDFIRERNAEIVRKPRCC